MPTPRDIAGCREHATLLTDPPVKGQRLFEHAPCARDIALLAQNARDVVQNPRLSLRLVQLAVDRQRLLPSAPGARGIAAGVLDVAEVAHEKRLAALVADGLIDGESLAPDLLGFVQLAAPGHYQAAVVDRRGHAPAVAHLAKQLLGLGQRGHRLVHLAEVLQVRALFEPRAGEHVLRAEGERGLRRPYGGVHAPLRLSLVARGHRFRHIDARIGA